MDLKQKQLSQNPSLAFSPSLQWSADAGRDQYSEAWFRPQKCLDFLTPTNLEQLVSVQDTLQSKPLFGLVPFGFLSCLVRHCQVSSVRGNVNPGELCVVSGFVRKASSVPECHCHLVTSVARLGHCLEQQELSDSQSPALDISPGRQWFCTLK